MMNYCSNKILCRTGLPKATETTGKKRSIRQSFVIGGIASFIIFSFLILPQQLAGITSEMLGIDSEVTVTHNLTHHYHILDTIPVTIVCQLSGEMGNNLSKLGHCLTLKWWLESGAFYNSTSKVGYDVRIALRHQDHRKWVRGQQDLQRCFPNTNQFDFSEANNNQFDEIMKIQHKLMLGMDQKSGDAPPFSEINSDDKAEIEAGLQSFVSKSAERHPPVHNTASNRSISMPFLFANRFLIDALGDQFYDEMRHFFHFNEKFCCNITADPDESVFHYRNFKQEMPKVWNKLGFHEADPKQASNFLFGHLKEGDKIAIVTRFGGHSTQPYVDEFMSKGFKVRVVDGQNGPADFCFLMSAQKEIVGLSKSSYFMWASYLGNSSRVLAYRMASSGQTKNRVRKYTSRKFDFRVIQ